MNWFYPSNPDKFRMVDCLRDRGETDQPFLCYGFTIKKAEVGDIVYIYVSKGYAQILFKTEVIATFRSFDEVNQGRWAKYRGRGVVEPPKGPWVRLRLLEKAKCAYKPLQCRQLAENDIPVTGIIYPLNRQRVEYIDAEIAASQQSSAIKLWD